MVGRVSKEGHSNGVFLEGKCVCFPDVRESDDGFIRLVVSQNDENHQNKIHVFFLGLLTEGIGRKIRSSLIVFKQQSYCNSLFFVD